MKVGLIFFSINCYQLIDANQGCCLRFVTFCNLSSAFFQNSLPKRSLRSLLQFLFKQGSLCLILSKSQLLFLEQKGGRPWMSSQMSDPRHHQSTALPCPSFLMTQGARYQGVPQTENVSQSVMILFLDSPKSVSFMQPSEPINMFQGFKLSYIKSTPCRLYFRVKILQCQKHLCSKKSGSEQSDGYSLQRSLFLLESKPKSQPPGQYQSTRNSFFQSWNEAWILMRKGWLIEVSISLSFMILLACPFFQMYFFFIDLMAYS